MSSIDALTQYLENNLDKSITQQSNSTNFKLDYTFSRGQGMRTFFQDFDTPQSFSKFSIESYTLQVASIEDVFLREANSMVDRNEGENEEVDE